MTQPLDEAVEAVRRLAPEAQDAIAAILRSITDVSDEDAIIPAEHLPAIHEGLEQLDRGAFIEGTPVDLVKTIFRRS